MILRRPLAAVGRLTLTRPEPPVGLAADRVSSFLLHRNAVRPEEQPALEGARQRDSSGARLLPAGEGYRVAYDEYRVKLYREACRAAREQREQLRLDWEQHDRERD